MREVTEVNKQSQDVYIDIECNFEVPAYMKDGEELGIIDEESLLYETSMNIALRLDYYGLNTMEDASAEHGCNVCCLLFKIQEEYLVHLTIAKQHIKSGTNEQYAEDANKWYKGFGDKYKANEEAAVALPMNMVIGTTEFVGEYEIIKYIDVMAQKLKEPGTNIEETLQKFKNGEKA